MLNLDELVLIDLKNCLPLCYASNVWQSHFSDLEKQTNLNISLKKTPQVFREKKNQTYIAPV